MDPARESQVKHLYEVEHLTIRQIAREKGITLNKYVSEILEKASRHRRTGTAPGGKSHGR